MKKPAPYKAPMQEVTLRNAFIYDCEECGKENLVRTIQPDINIGDIAALCAAYNVSPDEEHFCYTYPEEVECKFCGARYKTQVESF